MTRRTALIATGCAALTGLLAPAVARADAGGPILFLVFGDILLFGYGQVWIVLAEFLYLRRVFRAVPGKRVFGWLVLANVVSLFAGVLFFALTLPLYLEIFGPGKDVPNSYVAAWFLAMMIPTYFLSVLLEWLVLRGRARRAGMDGRKLLGHSFVFNLISYAGLVAVTLVFLLMGG